MEWSFLYFIKGGTTDSLTSAYQAATGLSQFAAAATSPTAAQMSAASAFTTSPLTPGLQQAVTAAAGKQIEGKWKSLLFFVVLKIQTTFNQDRTVVICSYTICHKNSPIAIWHPHSYPLVVLSRQKSLLTNRQTCQNVLVLYRLTIQHLHRRPSKRCMAFKLARNAWKCNLNVRKTRQSHIRDSIIKTNIYKKIKYM